MTRSIVAVCLAGLVWVSIRPVSAAEPSLINKDAAAKPNVSCDCTARLGERVARTLARDAEYAVLTENAAILGELAASEMRGGDAEGSAADEPVVAVRFYDLKGRVLAQSGPKIASTAAPTSEKPGHSESQVEGGLAVTLFDAPIRTHAGGEGRRLLGHVQVALRRAE
jgi:hypothetical protein